MSKVVDGVLLPTELENASPRKQRAYAKKVRENNSKFLDTYWKLEDKLAAHGLTMEDVEDEQIREGK